MILLFDEPRTDQCDLSDWGKLVNKTTLEMCGYSNIGLTNMDNQSAPQVMMGTSFYLNGSLCYVNAADAPVSGTPTDKADNYIYAVPGVGSATFTYGSVAPVFSAAKGGWYNGNNRAIAKLFYTGGIYNGKMIMDRYRYMGNDVQPIPKDGVEILNITQPILDGSISLVPGLYYYDIQSAIGGVGGAGGKNG